MPIPTTATAPPLPQNPPGQSFPNYWTTNRPEYLEADNNKAMLMRQQPQLFPRPQSHNVPSGFYNVFLTPTNMPPIPLPPLSDAVKYPITDDEVLIWARSFPIRSLLTLTAESSGNSNIRAINNIFRPSGFVYSRANPGIVPPNNTPNYPYVNAISNDLSNAGTNYNG